MWFNNYFTTQIFIFKKNSTNAYVFFTNNINKPVALILNKIEGGKKYEEISTIIGSNNFSPNWAWS